MMKVVKDESYDDMAATFQTMLFHWINDAMQQAGIDSLEARKETLRQFGFVFGVWFDQYWFEDSSGRRVFPLLAFSEQGPPSELEPGELGQVHLPTINFSFKEYAMASIDSYFDEMGEDVTSIPSGPD